MPPDPSPHHATAVERLACDLIAIDSRSSRSNLAIAERVEAELTGFTVERIDYTDDAGTAKRVLVAHRGPPGGLALCGHVDTVPDTNWTEPPWEPRLRDGILYGLGSVDMKGPLAAALVAARSLPESVPVTLLVTTDEETTKAGARAIAGKAELVRSLGLRGIIVAEPTGLVPMRGHRSFIEYTAESIGTAAHSSTGQGINANWALIPFLAEMREIYLRLRSDHTLQDPAYDPPFSDFNLILDNHGTALNVTVARATARIKFRRSRGVDVSSIEAAVREAAQRHGLQLHEKRDGPPMELPADHPLVRLTEEVTGATARTAPWGTDASILQDLAPCVVLGPGTTATAHTPRECVALADLVAAVPIYQRLLSASPA